MKTHHSAYINGLWQEGNGISFSSFNPFDQSLLWQGGAASKDQVDLAINAAHQAQLQWGSLALIERMNQIERYRSVLENRRHELSEVISKETGKPLWDSKNEVGAMINKIAISIRAFNERCPERTQTLGVVRSVLRHRPHGVVAVFGPFNFPGHLPNGHIVPALLAGNCVIFKPSELTPLVAQEMMECFEAAEFPKGVINLVQGGRETGKSLAYHSDIQGVFFTGSYQTGLEFSRYFGEHVDKILALEMGGNNPLIVSKTNHIKLAAYHTIQSAYLTSGQRCTCARRLIVLKDQQGDQFIQTLSEMIKSIVVGPYTQVPEPFMGPVISQHHAKKLIEEQSLLVARGGNILVEMKHLDQNEALISPALIDVTGVSPREDREIFGPLLQVIRVSGFEEAVNEANHTRFGLAAGLISDSREEYDYFFKHIKAGVVNWNTPLTGASSQTPFGGVGLSGNFHPSAYYAADYCSYPVSSLESDHQIKPESLTPGIEIGVDSL